MAFQKLEFPERNQENIKELMSMISLKKCKNKPLSGVVHTRIISKENILSMQVSSVFTMVKRYVFAERRFTTTGAEF